MMNTQGKAIGMYIHIPFCQRKCHYCDFPSYAGMENYWEAYTEAVVKELTLKAEDFSQATIKTLFIGGGTPSLLPYRLIERILETVHSKYRVIPHGEATIEANPGTLTPDKLKTYRKLGLNRISLGLQAAQEDLLKKLGRIHSYEDFLHAVDLAHQNGFQNINADLIFGIPGQSLEDWRMTLERVTALDLTHLSCYSLKIEEDTLFGDLKNQGRLEEVEEELDREMYHMAIDYLAERGFAQYELSNFAKPHYSCQHNINYWECGEYMGIGAGAHSFARNRRFANTPDVAAYIGGIKTGEPLLSEDITLDMEDRISERVILGLRMNRGVDLEVLSLELNVDLEMKYAEKIEKLLAWKLVEHCGTVLKLTKRGMDLANSVFIEFID